MSSDQRCEHSNSSRQVPPYEFKKDSFGQNHIVIPAWNDQDYDSTTRHIYQQNRLLKNRIKHLQGHLEQALNQYKTLHAFYAKSQAHQKQLLIRVNELAVKNKQLKNSISKKDLDFEQLKNDYECLVKREETGLYKAQQKYNRIYKQLNDLKQQSASELENSRIDIGKLKDIIAKLKRQNSELLMKGSKNDMCQKCIGYQSENINLKRQIQQNKRIINQIQENRMNPTEQDEQLKNTLKNYLEQLKDKNSVISNLKNQLQLLRSNYETSVQENQKLIKKIDKLTKNNKELYQSNEQANENIKIFQQQIRKLKNTISNMKKQVTQVQANPSQQCQQCHQSELQITRLKKDIEKKNTTIKKLNTQLQQKQQSNQPESSNVQDSLQRQNQKLKGQLEQLNISYNQLSQQHQHLVNQQQGNNKEKLDEKKNHGYIIKEKQKKIIEINNQLQQLQEKYSELQMQFDKLSKNNQKINKKYQELSNAKEEGTEQIQNYQKQIKNLQETIKKLKQQNKEMTEEKNKQCEQCQKYKLDYISVKKQLQSKKKIILQIKQSQMNKEQPLESQQQDNKKLQRNNKELQSKVRTQADKILQLQLQISEHEKERLLQREKKLTQRKIETQQESNYMKLLKEKDLLIEGLRKTIEQKNTQKQHLESQIQILRIQINEFKTIENKENSANRSNQNIDGKTSAMLEIEYNNELQQLRRLILYKKYSQQASNKDSEEKISIITNQYERRISEILEQYKIMQIELTSLREELLSNQSEINAREERNTREIEMLLRAQITRLTTRISILQEEKISYIDSTNKWQIAYEDLRRLYQAKLVSRDEHINLLKLKLGDYNFSHCYD